MKQSREFRVKLQYCRTIFVCPVKPCPRGNRCKTMNVKNNKKPLKKNILVLNKEVPQKNINRCLLFEFRGVNRANWSKA